MARSDREYKALSISEFTKAAAMYESSSAGVYETCKKDYPEIIEILKEREFDTLLDAGCGPAPLIALLAGMYPEKHFTGIDLTLAMIEKAKEKDLANAEFVVGDCENLPFEDNSFDVIVCCESFHHYPNPQDFFSSVQRCLKPGGILFLRDYAVDGFAAWLVNHLMMPLANLAGHGDVGVYSKKELFTMCEKAGLSVEEFRMVSKVKMNLIAKNKKQGTAGPGCQEHSHPEPCVSAFRGSV